MDERIADLTRTILDAAQADAEKINAEARHRESEILKRGELQAKQLYAEILDKARREAELRKEEKLAEITVKARVEAYERREQLLETVFSQVQNRVANIPDESNYAEALMGLVREAIRYLQSKNVVLKFDAKSRELISEEELRKLSSELGTRIEIGENLIEGTGVVAMDEKGHRSFENTLERRLERQLERLRSKVFEILIGENA
ncbi:MAG TPA: V-type ATP synthase subunit E family protein [Anaerolineaceae bacterium]|nr:V-type ATP synthase subunit E family protein [Anaerolineaceae bacterium]